MIVALILYNLILLVFCPIPLLILAWRLLGGKSRAGLRERFGFIPREKLRGTGPRIWLHAVSVGETVAAKPIWEALLAALPGWQLFHSTTTSTGQGQAVRTVGDRGTLIYFPFDFLLCTWRALARVRPRLVVLVETELWPNFIALSKLRGSRVMMANGIISDRSMRSARWLAPIYRWMTANVDLFCMQSQKDADRIIALGADPARVRVTGNTKFDQVLTEVPQHEQALLRDALGLQPDAPVLLAGSTHPGEEEIILRAFRAVKAAHPAVRLIIAPRHIQRAPEVEELVTNYGCAAARRTKLSAGAPAPADAVIILDTIGELARAYALCCAAFIGGSLVPIGGHNVLEPLGLGKPALFGPHMHKSRDLAAIVLAAGVGFQIADEHELARQWTTLLEDAAYRAEIKEHAKGVFQQHRGAAARCAHEAVALVAEQGTERELR